MGWELWRIQRHVRQLYKHGLLVLPGDILRLDKLKLMSLLNLRDAAEILVICTVLAWVKNPLTQDRLAGNLRKGMCLTSFLRKAWEGSNPAEHRGVYGEYNACQCNWTNRKQGLQETYPETEERTWEEEASPLILFAMEMKRVFGKVDIGRVRAELDYALEFVKLYVQFLGLVKNMGPYPVKQGIRSALFSIFPWHLAGDKTIRELFVMLPDENEYIGDGILDLRVKNYKKLDIPCEYNVLSLYMCLTGGFENPNDDECIYLKGEVEKYRKKMVCRSKIDWVIDPSPKLYAMWLRNRKQCSI